MRLWAMSLRLMSALSPFLVISARSLLRRYNIPTSNRNSGRLVTQLCTLELIIEYEAIPKALSDVDHDITLRVELAELTE